MRRVSKNISIELFKNIRKTDGHCVDEYTVVVFASGAGNPMAQFGSQDLAAMTNHHLSFFLSFYAMFYLTEGNRLGSLTNSVTTTRKK